MGHEDEELYCTSVTAVVLLVAIDACESIRRTYTTGRLPSYVDPVGSVCQQNRYELMKNNALTLQS